MTFDINEKTLQMEGIEKKDTEVFSSQMLVYAPKIFRYFLEMDKKMIDIEKSFNLI